MENDSNTIKIFFLAQENSPHKDSGIHSPLKCGSAIPRAGHSVNRKGEENMEGLYIPLESLGPKAMCSTSACVLLVETYHLVAPNSKG